jgi:hypothetical protein
LGLRKSQELHLSHGRFLRRLPVRQYHQSYELALRNSGLSGFRMFLMGQGDLDQGAAAGGGLDLNLPLLLGSAWSVLLADVVQDLEYQTRPYETKPGETVRASKDAVEILHRAMLERPARGKKWSSLAWHLASPYFVNAMKKSGGASTSRGRPPAHEAQGEDHRRVLPANRGRRPQLQHHRWLEAEGPRSIPRSSSSGSTT